MSVEPEHVGDCPAELELADEEDTQDDIARKLLKCPEILAALQTQRNLEMMANLPEEVKRRIKALKNIQLDVTRLEAEFFKEVHLIECKYHNLYLPYHEKRGAIISGTYEPTEEECQWNFDDDEDFPKDLREKEDTEEQNQTTQNKDINGIPDFWLTIFKNVDLLSEIVQDHDEPVLKYLQDIKVSFMEEPMGFALHFHFGPNEYFTNPVLTKEYDMKCTPDEDDPFGFEGPEIYRCRGCIINWNNGKNVTLKTVKKKQKHKSRGLIRTVTKTVQNESFFNFFSPASIPDDINETEVDEETRNLLTSDFEIGHYIRERIVPRAVLYFTGEGIEDEENDDEEEDDEEDEEDDSDSKEHL